MLIINADDFGRNRLATDRTLICFNQGRMTSMSAMVFMEDSQRAAESARALGCLVGLHLNFSQKPTPAMPNSRFGESLDRIAGFLNKNKYNFMLYHPFLRRQFEYLFRTQLEEFIRLYGESPAHIDGHHHLHLCTNMLIHSLIPKGQKIRRNFSFLRGEKNLLNRTYRAVVDAWLKKNYVVTDYLFSLSSCLATGRLGRVFELAKTSSVELETHPVLSHEFDWLTGDALGKKFPFSLNNFNSAHLPFKQRMRPFWP